MRDKFTVALVQMSCGPEPADNLAKALDRVAEAARKGADVVCLPELFQTQYFCQREDAALFDLAEPIPGVGTERLAAAARQNKVVLIASLFEKRAPGLYHNTAAIFDSDGVLRGIYRKMHIPDDPLYYEKFYFAPGDLGFKAFDTSAGKLGTLVCWDQWYPEGARLTALQGASILFYPTAIGWHPAEKAEFGEAQHDAWRTIQRAHAIANGVYVGAVNRVGFETGDIRGNSVPGKGLEFWGGSFFCDPFGRVLAEASHDQEEILFGEVDLHQLEDIRRNWPFLRDRRVDAYAPITSRMLDSGKELTTPMDSERIGETARWSITTDKNNFANLKNDESFWSIVALGRAVNTMLFVHQALVAHEGDDSPAAVRARYNAVLFSCAIFFESHLLVQNMGRHFSSLPEFRKLSDLFNDRYARNILDKVINGLRNTVVFHFDPEEIGRQLQGLEMEKPIFLEAMGKTNSQIHCTLADLCAFRTLYGSSFPASDDLEATSVFTETLSSLIVDFSNVAQELIVAVLNKNGWYREVPPG